jgi:hypothetical protein
MEVKKLYLAIVSDELFIVVKAASVPPLLTETFKQFPPIKSSLCNSKLIQEMEYRCTTPVRKLYIAVSGTKDISLALPLH